MIYRRANDRRKVEGNVKLSDASIRANIEVIWKTMEKLEEKLVKLSIERDKDVNESGKHVS